MLETVPAHLVPSAAFNRDDPLGWLGMTPLVDFEDCRVRLKATSLTQLCKTRREKAMAIYGFVKRITLHKSIKLRHRTAREVLDAGSGDANDKVTLLVALLRAAGIPARVVYAELRAEILRGLVSSMTRASRPVAEIWLGRWVRTDTYIFDAAYLVAARQRLKDENSACGYGIHVGAHALWDGSNDAFLGAYPTESDPMVIREFGPFNDPSELRECPEWRADFGRVTRALHWNMLAPGIDRVIRELREESMGPVGVSRA